ncbi:MAG: M20/M25/M40 family metallo-hydrolase [Chloroflexi bacterium]|nr:M20/M25/M40 family metallo-hydrolase [Chloroflexota bacterium]
MEDRIQKLARALKWGWLPQMVDWTTQQAIAIQQIPAPTFHEQQRALYVMEQFRALGLREVEIDRFYNVYGLLPGQRPSRWALMLAAHTDTVFPAETNLAVAHKEDFIYGPGLGDNSMGVAGLLALAAALKQQNWIPDCDLWFVATTREEGLGDLGGMRGAFDKLNMRITSVINLEGLAFGHVYHAGIAVRRLHIKATASGGHSWLHFGRASAIHGIVELGAQITALRPPQNPRTTYNIGMIEGGQSINSIATQAGLWLDLRSEDSGALQALEQQVYAQIATLSKPDLALTVEIVGDRPAGSVAATHPLVLGALAALAQVGVRGTLESGSTDANVPLAAGCPAVTIGITRGGNAHRTDEYIETKPIAAGLQQLVLLTLAAAQGE